MVVNATVDAAQNGISPNRRPPTAAANDDDDDDENPFLPRPCNAQDRRDALQRRK